MEMLTDKDMEERGGEHAGMAWVRRARRESVDNFVAEIRAGSRPCVPEEVAWEMRERHQRITPAFRDAFRRGVMRAYLLRGAAAR